MKDIDLLPKWYKVSIRRRVNYRRQYIIIAAIFTSLVLWSFSASYTISAIEAQVDCIYKSLNNNKKIEQRYNELKDSLHGIQKSVEVLTKVESGIKVSPLLAELSHLVKDGITLTSVDVNAEEFKPKDKAGRTGVRFGGGQSNQKDSLPATNIRFKMVINGIAVNAADVTAFIASLEQSDYFRNVIVGYLQDVKKSSDTSFEVNCYINDYRIE